MSPIESTVAAVWRIESARLVGGLLRITRDIDLAEDLAQEALVVALERWPETGIPDSPGAWLMTTARNRALDMLRRQKRIERKHVEIMHLEADVAHADPRHDDVLGLMLVACHPILPKEARVALTLRLLGGLTTVEIALALLTQESAVAQRIVRAKRTLAEAKVPFEIPSGVALKARLPSLFEVLYLIFNEGYAARAGDSYLRPELCQEAMRLARTLAALSRRRPRPTDSSPSWSFRRHDSEHESTRRELQFHSNSRIAVSGIGR